MNIWKWKFQVKPPKNVFEAISPIRWSNCFFGLGVIHYPSNRPRIRLSFFYTISAFSVYVMLLSYMYVTASNSSWFGTSETIFFCLVYADVFLYFINIVLTWVWGKRGKNVLERFAKTDEILEELHVPLDYQNVYVRSTRVIVAWFILCWAMYIVDMMWFMEKTDLFTNVILTVVLMYPFYANATIYIAACVSMRILKWRLENLNGLLLSTLQNESKTLGKNNGHQRPEILWTVKAGKIHHSASSQNSTNNILRIAKHLHLEWTILCEESARVFGLQLALGLTSSFLIATGITLVFYIIMVSPRIHQLDRVHRIPAIVLWLVSTYFKVLCLNISAAITLTEWQKTGQIIHELGVVCKDKKDRDQIRQFSLQIIQNPLSIQAFGLISLGDNLFLRFISSVITYVVILVQMYNVPMTSL